ncbi:MAG: hypothetical protein AAGC43_09355 [Bacteroidota bacterium]
MVVEKALKRIGFLLVVLLINNSCVGHIEGKYSEIYSNSEVNIEVSKIQNNRGIAVINNIYWFYSNREVRTSDSIMNNRIYKLFFKVNHVRPKPRFGDLKVPFILKKEKGNDYLEIIKHSDTIFFNLTKTGAD